MKETLLNIKNSSVVKTLKDILSSKVFPIITATIFLLCYYLGWDMVLVYYVAFFGITIILLLDDISPLLTLLIFASVAISYKNSPSHLMLNSKYYSETHHIVQIVILLSSLFLSGVYRIVTMTLAKKFVFTPVFYGLCAFSLALICSGMFTENYSFSQFLYGLGLVVCFLFVFALLKDGIKVDEKLFERIAFNFFVFGILLMTELFIKYLTTKDIILSESVWFINRGELVFGWGIWNTMGMFVVMCIPSVFFLAKTQKFGYLYSIFSSLILFATVMSCSRQAILAASIIYSGCWVLLLLNKRHRIINLSILSVFVLIAVIVIAVFKNTVVTFFYDLIKELTKNEMGGNGRKDLWKQAIEFFESAPIFGVGFFAPFDAPNFPNVSFVPLMAHNTFFQLLSACGIVGLATYIFHRVQTVISFVKNITYERLFLALTIIVILMTSLFDNHIFYIFPTLIYSSLLAVLVASEKKDMPIISLPKEGLKADI